MTELYKLEELSKQIKTMHNNKERALDGALNESSYCDQNASIETGIPIIDSSLGDVHVDPHIRTVTTRGD